MRDVGFLVWVVLLIVGVVGSMVSSLRKQAQQAQKTAPTQRPPQQPAVSSAPFAAAPVELPRELAPWLERMVQAQVRQPPPARPRPVQPKPLPPKPAPVAPPPIEHPHDFIGHPSARLRMTRDLFAGRNIVRAVIAAEVLGKPRALGDEYFPR